MLYSLATLLQKYFIIFNVVHYISFRTIAASLTSLVISLLFGNKFIEYSRNKFKNDVRPFTPETHKLKKDTPTMGGCFILSIVILNILLWCDLSTPEPWLFIITITGFAIIGFIDDFYKIKYKKGILAKQKFIAQVCIALIVSIAWIYLKNPSTEICIPFFKNFNPDLGIFFIPWIVFIIVAMSNAVNLTDGLDGLATETLLTNVSVFSIISYLAGHQLFATYLNIPFTDSAEITVIGGALFGSLLGFLWFNAHPAEIFMGDVGSLPLGAALALMAIISKQELLLPIAGGLFVFEVLSVIGQYISIKYFGKKLLKMAPLHHHFELLGWKEPKITIRLNIVSIILCLLTLITLKIR